MSVTPDQVKAYREEHGVGMQDARRILERQDRAIRLQDVEDDLRAEPIGIPRGVILDLIDIVRQMNR